MWGKGGGYGPSPGGGGWGPSAPYMGKGGKGDWGKGGGGGDKGGKTGGGGDKGGKTGGGAGKSAKGGSTGKAGGREAVSSAKSYAKTYYSKSAKGTAAPTSSLSPTMLVTEPKGKSKGESVDLSWCPFGGSKGKSKGKSTGKRRMLKGKSGKGEYSESSDSSGSSDADLSNALGQEPGSSLLIQPSDDQSLCVQPVALEAGGSLEAIACTYEEADAFRVDRYGRLHTSQWSLCVTGVDGDLVLGSCDTCDAVFQYDATSMMISPYGDDSTVFTLKNGKMSLQEPVVERKGRFFFLIFQIFIIILFTGVPPTGSPAPTGSLVPL